MKTILTIVAFIVLFTVIDAAWLFGVGLRRRPPAIAPTPPAHSASAQQRERYAVAQDVAFIRNEDRKVVIGAHGYDAMLPILRDALGEEDLSKLMSEVSTWSEDQAVVEAMLI